MSYLIHKSKGILAEYIKCIWVLEENECESTNFCTTLIPSGSIEIIFHFGGKGKYIDNISENTIITNNSISGQKNKNRTYHSNDTKGILAVMLQPTKANVLLGQPSNLLSNKTYDLQSVFGNRVDTLLDQLNCTNNISDKIIFVEKFLGEQISANQKYIDPRLKEFEHQVKTNGGRIDIKSLSNYLNISKRQLERIILRSIGLTPKEFSKVIRFQKALHLKQLNKKLNITDLAYECGFSDQAHFINDFKSISGYTPKQYFSLTDPFSDYYTYN